MRKALLAGFCLLAGVPAAGVGIAPSTSAQQAGFQLVSHEVVCDTRDGELVADYTAKSGPYDPANDPQSWRALNPNVEIRWRFAGVGDFAPADSGAFTADRFGGDLRPFFDGSFVVPPGDHDAIEVEAVAVSGWGPNPATGEYVGGGEIAGPVTVELPDTCQAYGPVPEVTDRHDCAEGGIAVTLANSRGGADATFDVNGTEVTVPAGESVVHVVAAEEDTTVHITVTAHGDTLLDEDVLRDCETPPTTPSTQPEGPPDTKPKAEVLGVQLTRDKPAAKPAAIAATGRRTDDQFRLAMVLLFAGTVLVAAGGWRRAGLVGVHRGH